MSIMTYCIPFPLYATGLLARVCKLFDIPLVPLHMQADLNKHGLCQGFPQRQSSSLSILVSSQPLLLLFLKSYILPLFNYCDIGWSGSTKSEASKLETLHNYACHTVLRECKGFSPSAACRELGIFALASRSLAVTMFNCMPSKSPPYLSQFLSSPSSHYNTCSALSSQLNRPPIGPPLAKSH